MHVGFAESEALLARLESRRDPVKLNAHCFWMMWQYLSGGRFADSVAMCDRGIELADLIGSQPVQYGGIKAIALSEMGRYDEVQGAIEQEVTDDDHPFGQAMASLARSCYLSRVGAWPLAGRSLTETMGQATELSRVWMQAWAASLMTTVAAHLQVEVGADVTEMREMSNVFGSTRRSLAGAEASLVEGRAAEALDVLAPMVAGDDTTTRDRMSALELAARVHLALGDHDAALDAATRCLTAAVDTGFGSIVWQLHQVSALAHEGLGRADEAERSRAEARREFQTLAARITEPELREWFERQPLAHGLTGG